MKSCALFGPKNFPCPSKKELITLLKDLIENHGIDQFYVGNEGAFDAMVHWLLYGLSKSPNPIKYSIILALEPSDPNRLEFFDAYYPEELRGLPLSESIVKRDEWMKLHSDFFIMWDTYVNHS